MPTDAITEGINRMQQKAPRSWVQFEQRPVQNMRMSEQLKRWVGQDVDFVIITPPYGKDNVHYEVKDWLEELALQVVQGRLSEEDRTFYVNKYDAWKKGIEAPVEGTPIKGWGVISPSQQKTLIGAGVTTVEELAQINDEGVRRIGMGAVELKRKATVWLEQLQDKGPLTMKVAEVEKQNDVLRMELDTIKTQLQAALALIPKQGIDIQAASAPEAITAADLIPDEPKRGPGRPRKEVNG